MLEGLMLVTSINPAQVAVDVDGALTYVEGIRVTYQIHPEELKGVNSIVCFSEEEADAHIYNVAETCPDNIFVVYCFATRAARTYKVAQSQTKGGWTRMRLVKATA